jgi:hypothetical protein
MANNSRTEAIQLRATPIETIVEDEDLEIGQTHSNGYMPVPTSSGKRQSRHSRTESGSSFKMFTSTYVPEIIDESAKDVSSSDPHHLASQALPSLLISVAGLVIAGWLMDIFQVCCHPLIDNSSSTILTFLGNSIGRYSPKYLNFSFLCPYFST